MSSLRQPPYAHIWAALAKNKTHTHTHTRHLRSSIEFLSCSKTIVSQNALELARNYFHYFSAQIVERLIIAMGTAMNISMNAQEVKVE